MRLVPLLALVLAALILPATASASEIWINSSTTPATVVYRAYAGEANTVDAHLGLGGSLVNVYDQTAAIITTDGRCSIVHQYQARCTLPLGGAQFYADLGDRNDSFKPTPGTAPYRAIVDGGAGIDEITLGENQGALPSQAFGGDDNDIFHSSAQPGDTANLFFGGAGDDIVVTLNGAADGVSCGDGTDSVRADQATIDNVDSDCESVKRS